MANKNYDDIIDLPHHKSRYHAPMPMAQRAAQFLPFAALRGYAEALDKVRAEHIAKVEAVSPNHIVFDEGLCDYPDCSDFQDYTEDF